MGHRVLPWVLCVFASALLLHMSAEAEPALDPAFPIQTLMDEAEYSAAQKLLSKTLNQPHLSSEKRAWLYWLDAICSISLGNPGKAKSSLLKLFALDPGFEPESLLSPKVKALLSEAKETFLNAGGFDEVYQPRLTPLDDQNGDHNIPVSFSIGNLNQLHRIKETTFYIRRLGNSDYNTFNLSRDPDRAGHFIGSIPSELVPSGNENYVLEYYIEAKGESLSRLTGIGTHKLPLSFMIDSQKSSVAVKPKRRILWPYIAGAGTLVVSGIILGVFLLNSPQKDNEFVIHVTQ